MTGTEQASTGPGLDVTAYRQAVSGAGEGVTGERADLLETLAKHRFFLRHTVRDLTDEQARLRTTASALCLGGLVKHVSAVERGWVDFILQGTSAMGPWDEESMARMAAERAAEFELGEGETLAGALAEYQRVAGRTDELVATLPDLDMSHPLPDAPWFEAGTRWSARRVLLHIVAETAQHAGHADIIREALDGAKTMG
jgi:uncharacterized damage-inducible protein DinB